MPLPFEANWFDEIHAYHVLEHVGWQGDYRFFFALWTEFWRILKPGGHLTAIVPTWNCEWADGDPGHKNKYSNAKLTFLSQEEYRKQCGRTAMADYRFCYKADFKLIHEEYAPDGQQYIFVLTALKGD